MSKEYNGIPKTSQINYTGKGLLDEKSWVENLTDLKSLNTNLYNEGDVITVINEKKQYRLNTSLAEDTNTGYWREINPIVTIIEPKNFNPNYYTGDELYKVSSNTTITRYRVKNTYQWYCDNINLYYKLDIKSSTYTAVSLSNIAQTIDESVPAYLEISNNGDFYYYLVNSEPCLTYLSPKALYYDKTNLTKLIDSSLMPELLQQIQNKIASLFIGVSISSISEIKGVGTYNYTGKLGDYDSSWIITAQLTNTNNYTYSAVSTTDANKRVYSVDGTNWIYTGTLYLHSCTIYMLSDSAQSPMCVINVINSESTTTYTYSTLKSFLSNHGYTSESNSYGDVNGVAGGFTRYTATSSGGAVTTKTYVPQVATGAYTSNGDIYICNNWGGNKSFDESTYSVKDKITRLW